MVDVAFASCLWSSVLISGTACSPLNQSALYVCVCVSEDVSVGVCVCETVFIMYCTLSLCRSVWQFRPTCGQVLRRRLRCCFCCCFAVALCLVASGTWRANDANCSWLCSWSPLPLPLPLPLPQSLRFLRLAAFLLRRLPCLIVTLNAITFFTAYFQAATGTAREWKK